MGNGNFEGGPVYEDGDAFLASLTSGEHVLSAADVAAMGDQHAVYAFREALKRGPVTPVEPGFIEIEDGNGNRVTVTEAHWRRWPSVREIFRPVAETPDTPVSIEPPTGDKPEEN